MTVLCPSELCSLLLVYCLHYLIWKNSSSRVVKFFLITVRHLSDTVSVKMNGSVGPGTGVNVNKEEIHNQNVFYCCQHNSFLYLCSMPLSIRQFSLSVCSFHHDYVHNLFQNLYFLSQHHFHYSFTSPPWSLWYCHLNSLTTAALWLKIKMKP